MLLTVILLSYIVTVIGLDKSYTKESFIYNGKPCISDCIDNVRISARNEKQSFCNPGSRPGLQYYTARDRTQNKLCKSRCGKFDNSPDDWCYVSDIEWDYCNPDMGTEIVKNKAFTVMKKPCKSECSDHGYRGYVWCRTYVSSWYNLEGYRWDYCNTEKFTYMHTMTRNGQSCVGICGAHDDENYNWCVSTEEKEERCAPIARNFTIFYHMFGQLEKLEKKDSCRIEAHQLSYKHDSVPSGFVSHYAKLLEYPNIGLLREHLSKNGNPINVYTIMPYAVLNDPTLPIVVRARVTSETIRPLNVHRTGDLTIKVRENLERLKKNNDRKAYTTGENEHIISNILGGPSEVYNFAAPTQRVLKNGTLPVWYDTEVIIRDWIVKTNGWAKITIVLVYSNIMELSMPDGYAVDFALYDYDNTLYRECYDYYYSNHDNQ